MRMDETRPVYSQAAEKEVPLIAETVVISEPAQCRFDVARECRSP